MNVELILEKDTLVQCVKKSGAGQSDFTVGMTFSQNHGAGGPGGRGYPSFEVNCHFLRKKANKGTMVATAIMAVASPGLAFNMFSDKEDERQVSLRRLDNVTRTTGHRIATGTGIVDRPPPSCSEPSRVKRHHGWRTKLLRGPSTTAKVLET